VLSDSSSSAKTLVSVCRFREVCAAVGKTRAGEGMTYPIC
jgi:hypothetical protein